MNGNAAGERRSDENQEQDLAGADDDLAGIAHQANVNQVRQEPVPASHHADRHQLAVQRNEEHSAAAATAPEESEPEHTGEQGKRPADR